jgi:hypothetical protein
LTALSRAAFALSLPVATADSIARIASTVILSSELPKISGRVWGQETLYRLPKEFQPLLRGRVRPGIRGRRESEPHCLRVKSSGHAGGLWHPGLAVARFSLARQGPTTLCRNLTGEVRRAYNVDSFPSGAPLLRTDYPGELALFAAKGARTS